MIRGLYGIDFSKPRIESISHLSWWEQALAGGRNRYENGRAYNLDGFDVGPVPVSLVFTDPLGTTPGSGGGVKLVKSLQGLYGLAKKGKVVITSSVKNDVALLKYARELFKSNSKLRGEANQLIKQLKSGNMNPRKGTQHIGDGLFEARGANVRVYFRSVEGNVDILGYSGKSNQQTVIDRIRKVFL